jgi:hypothetical protein
MYREDRLGTDDVDCAVKLLIASARDLIVEMRTLGNELDEVLGQTAEIDSVISVLSKKKEKVETLKEVARQITSRLRVGDDGKAGVEVSEEIRQEFTGLMAEFSQMLEEEERLEEMVCGQGLQISRRSRR